MSIAAPRLTRCESCARVFDSAAFQTGATFACHCGATVTVREPPKHDSPVIRCSSCGGSRATNAAACTFCGASFTLRDRQLTGMCGHCGTRASRGDVYCHACGEPIVASEHAARPGDKQCPVCAEKHELTHRQLQDVALLECVHCGGVWLDRPSFNHLAQRAREQAKVTGATNPKLPTNVRPQPGPAYRRCIECEAVMQRKNYGRKSGVVVDICPKHGIWFDLHELEEVLAWLASGGVEAPEPQVAERERKPEALVGSTHALAGGGQGNTFADVVGFFREIFDVFMAP